MVKCKDCGLLALVDAGMRTYPVGPEYPAARPREYLEVSTRLRRGEASLRLTGEFVCFADEDSFEQDASNKEAEGFSWEAVINKERPRDSFYEYVLGYSPKEHVGMRFEEMLREREDQRDQDQRDWQARESRSNKRFRVYEILLVAATVGAIIGTAWIRPAAKVEMAPIPIEITLHEPVASDSGASQAPTQQSR